MGLSGNSHVAVDNARDKHATRVVMAQRGLPTPTNVLFEGEATIDELHAAADKARPPTPVPVLRLRAAAAAHAGPMI